MKKRLQTDCFETTRRTCKVGTELYMPPEAMDNYEEELLTQSRDIWGCGVAMFFISYKKHPFLENSKMKTTLNIYEGKLLNDKNYFLE